MEDPDRIAEDPDRIALEFVCSRAKHPASGYFSARRVFSPNTLEGCGATPKDAIQDLIAQELWAQQSDD